MELYKKYRPACLSEVVGQPGAVKMLQGMIDDKQVPHAIMFSGASGCGKTTLARILTTAIGCGAGDCEEMNCADVRGIDNIREIRLRMGAAPLNGRCRVYLFDEAHQFSKDAQQALLKMLEDYPRSVYFMLCTTDPTKLLPTVRSRCTEIAIKPIAENDLAKLVRDIAAREKIELDRDVIDRIVDVSDGGARKAIVLLDSIRTVTDSAEQLEIIAKGDYRAAGIELARVLTADIIAWEKVAKILLALEDDPEGVRRIVVGYAQRMVLGGKRGNPVKVLEEFVCPFYDTPKSQLVLACYRVCGKQ